MKTQQSDDTEHDQGATNNNQQPAEYPLTSSVKKDAKNS
jgi:hypothetical protein